MNSQSRPTETSDAKGTLRREIGVLGATMMGLGSIIGTGVFVSIGIAAGIAGPSVILAVVFAACVALCNALSSAQLAASHPVSGGTYEYGYQYLSPRWGFTAGWMFLCAKSASAATAALGFAGYLLNVLQVDAPHLSKPIALAAVVLLTLVVLAGIRRANWVNIVIVSVTLMSLGIFVVGGLPQTLENASSNLWPLFPSDENGQPLSFVTNLLHATALMFVAYTGYGRIATLGEEVIEPRRTIPNAIVTTLFVSALLYVSVTVVAVGTTGAQELASATQASAAPLEATAAKFNWRFVSKLVAIGAVTSMAGVMLNLILGLSRVLFAMGRRGDVPSFLGSIGTDHQTPVAAVITIGIFIAILMLTGTVKSTWTFSAFTVLIYYAITNLSALQLKPENRLYHRAYAWVGLASCFFLAFWVDVGVWAFGLVLIAVGLLFQHVQRRLSLQSR